VNAAGCMPAVRRGNIPDPAWTSTCARGPAESDEDWQDSEDPAGALLGAQLRPIPMSDELEVRSHSISPGHALVDTACITGLRRAQTAPL
jgi:hypothetical protein